MRNSLRFVFTLALVMLAGTASAQNFTATIDAAQETPPNASPATGSATLVLDTAANTLSYNIMYSGLVATEIAAHIHGFAPPGTPAGVLHPLPAGSPKIGVWNYSEAQEANIMAGLTYINIHTMMFPGGEIRGQIVSEPTDAAALPREFGLAMVGSNPTRSRAQFTVALPAKGDVDVLVYDARGKLVRGLVHGAREAGFHPILWNGLDDRGHSVASGVYYVRMHATGTPNKTVRVTLLR